MGCAGSTSSATREKSVHDAHILRRKQSIHALRPAEKKAVLDMYAEYKSHENDKLTKEGLRDAMAGVDRELFDFVWTIFDDNHDDSIDQEEFVMAMALLARGIDTPEAQLEAIFCMFDKDKDSNLTREECEHMVQATVNLNLHYLLASNKGKDVFEEQLQKEYSDENLAFWQTVRAYRDLETDGAARLAKAREIESQFVVNGAPREINLPSKIQEALVQQLKACTTEAPLDLFDPASHEIFSLMERDTYRRFNKDSTAIQKLVESYYTAAQSASESGVVDFASFKAWGMNEPSVLVFFTGLCNTVKKILHSKTRRYSMSLFLEEPATANGDSTMPDITA
mmetsp:Transcript_59025/g.117270  ORF Transcript_59025/g.117270 Transcript_59025/m.117270 type:complete len:339 (-) Transcript_59025:11-1027(-)|eukprot:CAMPEP_0174725862 /NCGR_PEP_ID=MMETSP1094-20130205/46566_1 /TAXON_ID=156173 /ORGANISM="Chrysochromulina brevifilum, Strain UTEX LB 985" /LENGTH=338 /DNA_ID=CAMNT_0015927343 /DNA_START=76 /DNA_END=1092 /DNA_ORIENTATION=-